VRNSWCSLGQILDGDGGIIDWSFIVKLFELQSLGKMHLGMCTFSKVKI